MFIAVSCVIITFLVSQTTGVHIISAISLTLFTIPTILYADDADILLSPIGFNDTAVTIRNIAQKAATIYQSGVHQAGGAIRPEKCRWYSITFQWIGHALLHVWSNSESYEIRPPLGPWINTTFTSKWTLQFFIIAHLLKREIYI